MSRPGASCATVSAWLAEIPAKATPTSAVKPTQNSRIRFFPFEKPACTIK
jgi:hypothetical protein